MDYSGVQVKGYHADNTPFNAKAFQENLKFQNQTIDFSGVEAHHQNGVAEREILTITNIARTMLLHAILMWPDQADITL